ALGGLEIAVVERDLEVAQGSEVDHGAVSGGHARGQRGELAVERLRPQRRSEDEDLELRDPGDLGHRRSSTPRRPGGRGSRTGYGERSSAWRSNCASSSPVNGLSSTGTLVSELARLTSPVMMMTGTSGRARRTCSTTALPPSSGMWSSVRTMSISGLVAS